MLSFFTKRLKNEYDPSITKGSGFLSCYSRLSNTTKTSWHTVESLYIIFLMYCEIGPKKLKKVRVKNLAIFVGTKKSNQLKPINPLIHKTKPIVKLYETD